MTSTDASNNNKDNSKILNNEKQEQIISSDISDLQTIREVSGESPCSSSAGSPSSSTSSTPSSNNDLIESSIDKNQLELKPKESKSSIIKIQSNKKSTTYNQNLNINEPSPVVTSNQQYINYYPYIPRQGPTTAGTNTIAQTAPPYSQMDVSSVGTTTPWSAAAMAVMAANGDPMALAYMNGTGQNGVNSQYPSQQIPNGELGHYDQFSFGFTPAFGFGYSGNGTIDYATVAAQQSIALNPQSNQWTPSSKANTNLLANSTSISSPTNTTTSSSDTNLSSSLTTTVTLAQPQTTAQPTTNPLINNNQAKWIQLVQDPLVIHEFNTYQQQQQLSPADLYNPHLHHHQQHSYRPHHHHQTSNQYQRQQQHLQQNYHHYQYNNHYHTQPMHHYQNNYQHSHLIQHSTHHHHYNPSKNYYPKQTENAAGFNNNNIYDNNNNSNKSNNLNDSKSEKLQHKHQIHQTSEVLTKNEDGINENEPNLISNGDSISKSDSKTWASIVGFSTTNLVSSRSSPSPNAQQQSLSFQQIQMQDSNFNEYTYVKQKNMNYKIINNNKDKNFINQQQSSSANNTFDLTNRSFPPISINSSNITKAELNENIKKSSTKKSQLNTPTKLVSAATNATNKKQQQYNNYQRQQQQQFNLPFSKTNTQQVYNSTNLLNSVVTNLSPNSSQIKPSFSNLSGNESPSNQAHAPKGISSYYYKRHQPSQPTISSFMTDLDKNKFDDNKLLNQASSIQPFLKQIDLDHQSKSYNITDSNQLIVFTNPTAYNPKEFNTSPKAARFFVIKSYSEDDVHRSIKYNIWCSTEHGNRRLDSAYFKGDGQVPVYLFFSVNGSGHFCGMAEMQSRVDYNKKTDVWSQDKWRGCFQVKWIFIKDVPNSLLRNIKLENNDNKPVTNSRDTQEIPFDKGRQVLKVFHTYNHSSSILDDFDHYERKQEEDKSVLNINNEYNSPELVTINQADATDLNQENSEKKTHEINISAAASSSSSTSSSSSIDESKDNCLSTNKTAQIEQLQLITTS